MDDEDEMQLSHKQSQRDRALGSAAVGAAAKQIALLQSDNRKLAAQLKSAIAEKEKVEKALKSEKDKHAKTKGKLKSVENMYQILESTQTANNKLRSKLETERESLRRQLANAKQKLETSGKTPAPSEEDEREKLISMHKLEEKDVEIEMLQVELEMLKLESAKKAAVEVVVQTEDVATTDTA